MYRLIYLPIARQDVYDTVLYIAGQLQNGKAAIDLLESLDHSITLLQEFPYAHRIYRSVKPIDSEYRFMPVGNYLIFYLVKEQEKLVEIHRVLYAKTDLSRVLK
jgi:toxin ParE1/3/4